MYVSSCSTPSFSSPANSAIPTAMCAVDGHTALSAIGISQRLDNDSSGTHYRLNYENVTVSESLNGG